jgi:hypothetical protein
MANSEPNHEPNRTIQSWAFAVACLGSIAVVGLALVRGDYGRAWVFGALASASGASLVAVRGRGLPAPITSTSRAGLWQMALLAIGSAAATVATFLWALGLWGTEDPLHMLGFVCAACGSWLTWRAIVNIRGMLQRFER